MNLPFEITFEDVRVALEGLGIPVDRVRSVLFDTDEVIVEAVRTDDAGRVHFGTVTTRIPYRREQPHRRTEESA